MIFNFGSINIDHVYRVEALPVSGQTIVSKSYDKFLGGKGVNQSIAISRAGGDVLHVGAVGQDGQWALSEVRKYGVATDHVSVLACATGHAMILVDDHAENLIVIEGGANQNLSEEMIRQQLSKADPVADWVLLQNETNLAKTIVDVAAEHGIRVAYSAAPFVAETTIELLPRIQLLAVNEGEARALATVMNVQEDAIPVPELLITRGAAGAEFIHAGGRVKQSAFDVSAVDTTGAGDTFLGSFMAGYCQGHSAESSLQYAAAASALQVMRAGAATAIPTADDVRRFLNA